MKIYTNPEGVSMIEFKSAPAFFDKERSGVKNNTVRKFNTDERVQFQNMKDTIKTIQIRNSETDELIIKNLTDISEIWDIVIFTWKK